MPSPSTLFITPPDNTERYANQGHSLALWRVAQNLEETERAKVTVVDGSADAIDKATTNEILSNNQYGLVAIMLDKGQFTFTSLRGLVAQVRHHSPGAAIVLFGRAPAEAPEFYCNEDYGDAVVHPNGDYEAGVRLVGRACVLGGNVPGVSMRLADGWRHPSERGVQLPPNAWAFVEHWEKPKEIARWRERYANYFARYCGLPGMAEGVIEVGRGCPIKCDFCEVWRREGAQDRRLSPQETAARMKNAIASGKVEYVTLYAPTLTLRKEWVLELCDELDAFAREGIAIPWKYTTDVAVLSESLVQRMTNSGCLRVSIGLEVITPDNE